MWLGATWSLAGVHLENIKPANNRTGKAYFGESYKNAGHIPAQNQVEHKQAQIS